MLFFDLVYFISHVFRFVRQHDATIDLAVVWMLAVGTAILSLVKLVSWLVLRTQDDQTMVGVSLKRQKLGEGFGWGSLSVLYSLTLYAYYTHDAWGYWPRLIVRVSLAASIFVAVVTGIAFIYYLLREILRGRRGYI